MNTDKGTKINRLLSSQPSGVVFLAKWLTSQGYSYDLIKSYRKNGWLKSIGVGALVRNHETIKYTGALYAMQNQARMSIHLGAKTALAMLGKAHYLSMSESDVCLFGEQQEKLPSWFKHYKWEVKIDYFATNFLPVGLGIVQWEHKGLNLSVSGAARAMLECLYLAPKYQSLIESYEIMEGLNNLRPQRVQELLENCKSIKVKRLFLYMAHKANHTWVQYINEENIDLGKGKRSIVKNGIYISKYKITVPHELEHNDYPGL